MEKNKAFTGQLRVMETANPKLYAVEIMALNSEINRNNWRYVNLEQHLNEFLDIPILTAYVMGGNVIGDGHNYNMKRDPKTGEDYASFTASDAERIVGWIPKDQSNVRLEVVDGVEWVIVKGNLWAWYAKELVDQIARQGRMEVSIETLVTDERKGESGEDVEEKYLVLGITILGNGVEPAVAGANIRTLSELSELRSNQAENILKAASYAKPEESPEEEEPDEDPDDVDEPEDDSSETLQNNEQKGVKKVMTYLSRKELAELGKKFPEFKVLAAVQAEDGAIRVCLMAKDASTSVYKMDSMDDTIVPEKFRRAIAKVNFVLGEDCDNAEIDACEMTEEMASEVAEACDNAKKLEAQLNAANERIKAMETAERTRRVQAAKDKAKAVLNGLNANRKAKERFEDSILNTINADIDAGKYTEKVNSDGLWIGDAEVERDVSFLCMNAQKEMDRKAKEASESVFADTRFLNNHNDDAPDGIDSLLSELDKI
ncbi:MAG: hypothetical protein J6S14_19590 [Clostridia bacterium]|nr:hypothetical protein [Clostridia bacterium]